MKQTITIPVNGGDYADYLSEELTVTLTRRELYWIRTRSKQRLDAALQGMSATAASPAKRSARREEYIFHRNLLNHLYGTDTDDDEAEALRAAEAASKAMEIQERAAKLRERADALLQEAASLIG